MHDQNIIELWNIPNARNNSFAFGFDVRKSSTRCPTQIIQQLPD